MCKIKHFNEEIRKWIFIIHIHTTPTPVIILFAMWLHLQFLKTKDNENHILFLCLISHVTEQIESKFAFSYQRTEMMNELMWPKKLAYWVYVCNNFIITLFFDILPSSV